MGGLRRSPEAGAGSGFRRWLATARGRPGRLLAKRLWPAPNRVEKCRSGAPRGERPNRKGRRDASLALASRRASQKHVRVPSGRPKHPASLGASLPLARPQMRRKIEGKEETEPTARSAPLNTDQQSYVLFDNLIGSARLC